MNNSDSSTAVSITSDPINIDEAFSFVADPAYGAITNFIGRVRNHNQGREVVGMSYDIFVPLAENILKELAFEARQQWAANMKIYIAHRQGHLTVGDISVIIAVGTVHRDEGFQACRYIIEEIKTRCPIWKQEHYVSGHSEWVKGHALCAK